MIHIGPRRVIAVHEFEALAVDDGTGIHVLTERVEMDFRREAKGMKRRSCGVVGIRLFGRTPQRIHTRYTLAIALPIWMEMQSFGTKVAGSRAEAALSAMAEANEERITRRFDRIDDTGGTTKGDYKRSLEETVRSYAS
eukprot:scaffold51757_cov42-Cyclotella_meneghiniana.AAC.9